VQSGIVRRHIGRSLFVIGRKKPPVSTRRSVMKLTTLLIDNRKEILEAWVSCILDTYSVDGARFMKRQPNRFANPVGHTFAREAEHIFDVLVTDGDPQAAAASIERINKIRAVQDFSASEAVAFIFFLKEAIRTVLKRSLANGALADQLLSLESKIDNMALKAFDSYMRCREKLFEIRCKDIRRQSQLRQRIE
jgi:hypothetical protein